MVAFLYFFLVTYLVWYSCVWGGGGEEDGDETWKNSWIFLEEKMKTIKSKLVIDTTV